MPSAFPPPCRIRVLVSPVACTVPGPLSPKTFQKQDRMLAFFWFFSLCFGLHVILLFKNKRKTVKNPFKINKNRGLGRSRGPLGGHLGAFWTPWASKAEKVPKKLVRGPPLKVPRGTLKSYVFLFFYLKVHICSSIFSGSFFPRLFYRF